MRKFANLPLGDVLGIARGVHNFVQLQLLHKLSGREDLFQFQILASAASLRNSNKASI